MIAKWIEVFRTLKSCPFCGYNVQNNEDDTLCLNGSAWRQGDGYRHYVRWTEKEPADHMCYRVTCEVSSGGCGANIDGDSMEEAAAAWNQRN